MMWGDIKGDDEDGNNSEVLWDALYSGGADGTTIRQQQLGGDRSDAESVGGFPSLGGPSDRGNDSLE